MSECISQVQSFNYFVCFDHWMQGPNLYRIDFNGITLYLISSIYHCHTGHFFTFSCWKYFIQFDW